MKVRIGFGLGTRAAHDPRRFAQFVDGLEAHGFDSLWLSERVTGDCPDPVVALAVAAGRTTRLKLGFSVLVLPGRNPMLLAKELATLDQLSAGRLLPAFGLGAVDPAEHQAFGVARAERGPRFDEALPLLRRFWTGEPVDHEGRFHRYEGARVLPRPHQDRLDVWLGGLAPSELRRCGRLGDGWLPSFCAPEDVTAGIPVVQQAAADAGRTIDPEHFGALVPYCDGEVPEAYAALAARRRPGVDPRDLVATDLEHLADLLRRHIEAGASKFVVLPMAEPDDWDAHLAEVAAAVLPLET
ncbi:MAG TPA: LLM class flavin-dependent oxidoreductase [Acidimicrobiales bacterium]|nr:LLM class flavin-dependent oxidoreductase [Acidimicrobiales bacterium]